ncbi:glycosyl hydrolase family 28 protein [Acetatifactor muris]|uniref:Exo-poly-alpha-D-galacturonosidase n=1 Tax=Acetatifactor muris TaxID=879566 RepID=A0A2K4ZNG1_9FIRM|nr:glycosyl hydrolase family 28-related protein [Acetatifactor muris]MCR2050278.1 glycosyl hydrolase family 28 protein [Acetatifactor muris]SOY31966.1 Exo-poly-alpha-D-galacturonosidase precursor [Acetatifactor muris]
MERAFSVIQFGATGNGETPDTKAIQSAIDACHENGGGTVYFPPGNYVSAGLTLKSNVTLELEAGATLLKKTEPGENVFLQGERIENVTIKGRGAIDGRLIPGRGVFTLVIRNSGNIRMEQVKVLNSSDWALTFNGCSHVKLLGISIIDGRKDSIDLVCCQNVQIDGVYIKGSGDDCICIKNESEGHRYDTRPDCGFLSENIVVSNTVIEDTTHPAFKIGTGTAGIFRNIIVHDCIFRNFNSVCCIQLMRPTMKETPDRVIENVRMSNIFAEGCNCLVDITQVDVAGPIIRNISLENIRLESVKRVSRIMGYAGAPIENVSLKGISFAGQVLTSENPLLKMEYVNRAVVSEWSVEGEYSPVISLKNCKEVLTDKILSSQKAPLLKVEGSDSERIVLDTGCLATAPEAVIAAEDVPERAVLPEVAGPEYSFVEGELSVLAGSGFNGKLMVKNKGAEGWFRRQVTVNGRPAALAESWLYRGETKEIPFTTCPLYETGKCRVSVEGQEWETEVIQTPGKLWIDPSVEVREEAAGFAFLLRAQNLGGTKLTEALYLKKNDVVLDEAAFALMPGEEKEICLRSKCPHTEGDRYQIPGYLDWNFRLAANTCSKYEMEGNRISITAGGKLYSDTGELEYLRIFEYAAMYQRTEGDFEATVRVMSQDFTGQYASAGLLICNNMSRAEEDRSLVVMTMAPKYGAMGIWRADEDGDGETEMQTCLSANYGYWLRIVKRGNVFRAYYSSDYENWKMDPNIARVTAAEKTQDVAVFSYANSVRNEVCRAVFQDFTIRKL